MKTHYIFIVRKGINELDFNSIRKIVETLIKVNLYKYEENLKSKNKNLKE